MSLIKIIGVGSPGASVVEKMSKSGMEDVSFAVIDTDYSFVSASTVKDKICFGNPDFLSIRWKDGVPIERRDWTNNENSRIEER